MEYFVDSHSHINDDKFKSIDEVIHRANDARVKYIIVPGWDIESSEKAIKLAETYDSVYAIVGFHPHEAYRVDHAALRTLEEMASHKKVVGIGEIGLDYHYNFSPPEAQQRVFEEQILIAKEKNLPVSIHSRESDLDLLHILERHATDWILPRRFTYQIKPQPRGVLHSFNSPLSTARKGIELGFYLGISGMITFTKRKGEDHLSEILRHIQPEHFLLETDAPYLTPFPFRGRINEPSYIPLIAAAIAQAEHLTTEDVARITSYNAYKLFGIGEQPKPRFTYKINNSLYINLTMRCDSDCIFCDRKGEAMVKGYNLHIEREPSVDEIISEIEDPSMYDEIVFCGYGEPTIRLDALKQVAQFVKNHGGKTRLDTDGHGSLINHRDIVPELVGLIDSVSISLNSLDPDEYGQLMQVKPHPYFDEMIKFAMEANEKIGNVTMTVVELDNIDTDKARRFVEQKLGAKFKIRPLF
ncbi:MAG: TatD family hydrolase [Candidatus Kryptoniota bacterium]